MKGKFFLIPLFILVVKTGLAQDATEIVKKSDAKMRGEKSSYSEMSMQIIRPAWQRTVSFKSWSKGTDYSLAFITAPAKDKGQSFLKRKNEMWNWNPSIRRMIKLPPSMLSQGWMGSDFTNDDLLNQSSIVVDFTHSLEGSATVDGSDCYKVLLLPKENAPVVWGKVVLWISKNDFFQLKSEYFDEDMILVKTELASDIKSVGGRIIPTRYELIPAGKDGEKTVVILHSAKFDISIPDAFFSQQNLMNPH